MKSLIIYNQDGKVLFVQSGDVDFPESVEMVIADLPAGHMVESVNVDTKEPVLAQFPKSETERRLDELESRMDTVEAIDAAYLGTEA